MERRILQGLSCEWEAAVEALPYAHRRCMQKPMFRLGDMDTTLGYWSSDRRLICISRRLALESPWGDVREVLFHEMAHQLADQLPGGRRETAHGDGFRQACLLLGADPAATVRKLPPSRRVFDPSTSHPDPVAEKVRKLLALSGSENHHEARAALAKAHRLIERHNLPSPRPRRNSDFVSLFLGEPALRHPRQDYHLAALLLEYHFVEGVWVSAFVLNKGKMGRVLEISGTPSNVRIAAYVHDCVQRYIATRWRRYRRHHPKGRRRTDFAVGVVEGFRETLERARAGNPAPSSSRLPVPAKDPALGEYLARRHPHTTRVRKNRLSVDASVWAEGKRQGRRLVVRKAVESDGGMVGQLPHEEAP